VVLQAHSDCSVGEISLTIQLLFVGIALLVVKVDTLTLDPFKLVYLCAECVYIGYNAGVP